MRDTNWNNFTEAYRKAIGAHRHWERMVEAIPG